MRRGLLPLLAALAVAACDKPVVGDPRLIPPGDVKKPSPEMAKLMAEYSRSLELQHDRCVSDCEVKGNPCVFGYCDGMGRCDTGNVDGAVCDHPVDGPRRGLCKNGKCVPRKGDPTTAVDARTEKPPEKTAPPASAPAVPSRKIE